jgi:hypothetical protein
MWVCVRAGARVCEWVGVRACARACVGVRACGCARAPVDRWVCVRVCVDYVMTEVFLT